jgi:hypothetical protein
VEGTFGGQPMLTFLTIASLSADLWFRTMR